MDRLFYTACISEYFFVKAIQYYQKEKGLEVYGCCIMASHIHLILRAGEANSLEEITRDLKGYTSRAFRKILKKAPINICDSKIFC